MRKFWFLTTILLISISAHSQWQWLNPKPSGYPNTKILFTDNDFGYLYNVNGDLFKTSNHGQTWVLHQNFPHTQAMDLKDSTGVIGAYGEVYISENNGNTWQKKMINQGQLELIDLTEVISRDTIYVFNRLNKKIFKSYNRGQTWISVIIPFSFGTVDFVNSMVGYAGGDPGVYKTIDGGNTWQQVYTESSSISIITVKFFNTDVGFAFDDFNSVLRTTNGGQSWIAGVMGDKIFSVFFINQSTVYAAGDHGVIYRTDDGGVNWNYISPSARIAAYDHLSVYFFNANEGFVTGLRGRILKTVNGGATWQEHATTYLDIVAFSFGNSNIGYAAIWNTVFKTTDKGQTWDSLPPISLGPYSAFGQGLFFNPDTGILTASEPAKIYKTTNGGQTWIGINPAGSSYEYVAGISFINNSTGYASLRTSSAYGIFKTTNGADTWQEIGSYQNFFHLQFVNENTGYATRFQKLFRSIDGANTWTEVLDIGRDIESIWFHNAAKGFVAGEAGILRMTLDSGKTWTPIIIPNHYDDFVKIKFFNDNIGYLTADQGKIFKTLDGGLTWYPHGKSSYNLCRYISFTSDTSVYIAGQWGSILKENIGQVTADSLKTDSITSCGVKLIGRVIAAFRQVDGIWFEYGTNNYTNTIAATPFTVNNATVFPSATITGLTLNTEYKMRVKLYSMNQYYYSDSIKFFTKGTPTITAAGNILTSSSPVYNQWLLNGTVIPGATNQTYNANVAGMYTVQVSYPNCPVLTSANFNHVATGIADPLSWPNEIQIYPNPVTDELVVKNNSYRLLKWELINLEGRIISTGKITQREAIIIMKALPSGSYILKITDTRKLETISKIILKL